MDLHGVSGLTSLKLDDGGVVCVATRAKAVSGSTSLELHECVVACLATRAKTAFQMAASGAGLMICVSSGIVDLTSTAFELILE